MGTAATQQELEAAERIESHKWTEILSMKELQPGYPNTRYHSFEIHSTARWTHLRLNLYPDGGIARFKVFGTVIRDWSQVSTSTKLDLIAVGNGGKAIYHSNAHYGVPSNLINPTRALDMGDGWETARRPDRPAIYKLGADGHVEMPGSDFAVLKLGHPGIVEEIEIDTSHFKGNFPESCFIEACFADAENADELITQDCEEKKQRQSKGEPMVTGKIAWKTLLPRTKLGSHEIKLFPAATDVSVITHIRLNIYPDGGVSRLRLFGHISK